MEKRRDEKLLDRLVSRRVLIAQLEAEEAADMLDLVDLRRSEAVASGFAEPESAASFAADEIGVELNASTYTVQNRIHAARTVRDDLPQVWAAHCAGRVDGVRVRIIAESVYRLELPESPATLDEKAAAYAASHTPSQLRSWLRRQVARLEPREVVERRRRQLENRSAYISHDDDGVAWLHAMMSSEDAVLIDRELQLAAKAAAEGDERTVSQMRVDVLIDRLLGRSTDHAGRGRFHLGVTIPFLALAGLENHPGVAVDGTFALPPELIREIARQPGTLFSRIVTDPAGGVLDVTELGRFPTGALDRALELIDGVCAFPTCTAPAVNSDKDHQVPHPRGPTTGANLWDLCRRHHRMKTRGVVDTDVGTHGRHLWRLPSNKVVQSRAHMNRTHTALSRLEAQFAALADVA